MHGNGHGHLPVLMFLFEKLPHAGELKSHTESKGYE